MQVLVTGATGFVGREVLRQIVPAGHAVRVLARTPASAALGPATGRVPIQVVAGDLGDPASLRTALTGVEAVIHLVGIISEIGANTFENVHARGTTRLVQAAVAAGVRRFVHLSALGTRPNAVSRYHRTKWEGEEAVRGSGLAWTVLRPSLIYGPEDHFVNLFAQMSRCSPVLPVMGAGWNRLQPVAVEAVARCCVGALEESRSVGRTLDVCGAEQLTFLEILDTILAVAGRRRLKLRLPLPVARAQAAMLEWVYPRLFHQAPPLNRDQLLMLQEDNLGDPLPAQTLFQLPTVSFRDGIARYLKG